MSKEYKFQNKEDLSRTKHKKGFVSNGGVKLKIKTLDFIFLKTIVIGIVLFLLIKIITYRNDLPIDGLESMGFPYNFYTACGDCSHEFQGGFELKYLLLDLAIIFTSVFLLGLIFRRKRKFKESE